MQSKSKPSSRRKSARKNGGQQSLNSHLLQTTDLELALADGSVLPRSDAYEIRTQSNTPPLQVPRNIRGQLFWSKHYVTTSFTLSAVAETTRGYAFHLNDLTNYTHFTGLFDQYAVVCVVATVGATYNVALASAGNTIPRMFTVIDHDDVAPAATSALTLNPTCKITKTYQKQTRLIYPRVAVAGYSGAFSSFVNQRSWVDAASPSVEHYGLKVSCEADALTSVIDIELQYFLCFRNVHNA